MIPYRRTILPTVILLGALLCSCSGKGDTVNLAAGRMAVASSNYDYNLTAQLLTDGLQCEGEPAWLKVSTKEGELPRREKEWTLDTGPYSSNTLDGGSDFIEYEWSGQRFTAACVRIVGTLVHREGAGGWSVECFAGDGDLKRVGGLSGDGLPGTPRWPVVMTDPNKQSGVDVSFPSRTIRMEIPLEGADNFDKFKIEFSLADGVCWEIKAVDFTLGPSFGESTDTGPYDSEGARGMNMLPAESFSSAWMSSDGAPQWVKVDLGGVKRLSGLDVHWIHGAARTSLEISRDGERWRRVGGLRNRKARYVRLGMEGADSSGHFAIGELEIFGRETAGESTSSPWKLRRAAEVDSAGEDISLPGFDASGWMDAEVPGTVLYSYIAAGAVPDPAIADNNQQISESYFNSDFWYRWETSVETSGNEGKRTLLTFDGINWKAEVFMNGKRLGDIEGAFTRGVFDVTGIVKEDNIVAVHVVKPAHFGAVKEKNAQSPDFNGGQLGADNPTFHASVGWDWIPTVRGRETGIWNGVHLDFVDDVVMDNPMVSTRLAKSDTLATMTLAVDLRNLSDKPVSGLLEGTLDTIRFLKRVSMAPGETRTVVFHPSEYPQLKDRRIALWWPVGYGSPVLHPASYKFTPEGRPTDSLDIRHDLFYMAGIREFTYRDIMSDFKMYINGHRFTPKGGNWGFSEFNLRYGAREYDTAVGMHREMNLNMIRNWVGQTGDEEFYEACDKYGIVVWQDFWLANPADGPDPDDEDMFVRNAVDLIGRIRHHPCVGLYCGRNEGYPPASLDARLRSSVASLHGDIAYIPNSADDGVSGHGPYRAVEPDEYFRIPTHKFHSERGMPAIMNYGSLLRTMTADHVWPYDDVWGQHDFTRTGAQGDTTFIRIVRDRYGDRAMESAGEFAKYAQYLNYDGYRAMYEANNVERKGLLIWMSHSCWPSLAWQTYDYWFDRTWAFLGVQKACEPLHVQINPVSRTVQAVNTTPVSRTGLKAKVNLCGLDGKAVYSKETLLDIGEDSTVDIIDISDVPDGPALVTLELTTEDGTVLSTNRYMRNFKDGDDTGDYREIVGMKDLVFI